MHTDVHNELRDQVTAVVSDRAGIKVPDAEADLLDAGLIDSLALSRSSSRSRTPSGSSCRSTTSTSTGSVASPPSPTSSPRSAQSRCRAERRRPAVDDPPAASRDVVRGA